MITDALHNSLAEGKGVEENCIMELRQSVFKKIVNESNTFSLDLEENVSLDYTMTNRTINTGYRFVAYQTKTESYRDLGRGYYDRIDVENEGLLQELSRYNKGKRAHHCPSSKRKKGGRKNGQRR